MNTEMFMIFLACFIGVFAITVISARALIPVLKSKKVGQKILEIGPRWHKSKEGTPTMGGISFIIATSVVALLFYVISAIKGSFYYMLPSLLTLALAYANGLIGFVDDYTKLIKKQNEGLTAAQKYLLQLLVAAAYLVVMKLLGFINTMLYIPYFGILVDIGIFYYVFALILITGIINSVNLTDGIDGLASSVTFVFGAFISLMGVRFYDHNLTFLGSVAVGATLGFLVYNFYPARVFMGDTGSLFLGGLVVGTVFMMTCIYYRSTFGNPSGRMLQAHKEENIQDEPDTSSFRKMRMERGQDSMRLYSIYCTDGGSCLVRSVK